MEMKAQAHELHSNTITVPGRITDVYRRAFSAIRFLNSQDATTSGMAVNVAAPKRGLILLRQFPRFFWVHEKANTLNCIPISMGNKKTLDYFMEAQLLVAVRSRPFGAVNGEFFRRWKTIATGNLLDHQAGPGRAGTPPPGPGIRNFTFLDRQVPACATACIAAVAECRPPTTAVRDRNRRRSAAVRSTLCHGRHLALSAAMRW